MTIQTCNARSVLTTHRPHRGLLARMACGLLLAAPLAAFAQMPPMFSNQGPDKPLTPETRELVLNKVAQLLRDGYALPELGNKMADALESKRKSGAYEGISSSMALTTRITQDLFAIAHDKHLNVFYNGKGITGPRPPPLPDAKSGEKPKDVIMGNPAESNFEYHEARWLPGNVGYLKVSSFGAPEPMSQKVRTAAMTFLANTDALIIDIRGNTGGGPPLELLSYFFDEPTLLSTTYWRSGNNEHAKVVEQRSVDLGEARYGSKRPVYILTDKVTFSAAEFFAYSLQSLGRAKIVGETTGGGAHPSTLGMISENFAMVLPTAYSVNPVTKSDWEGVGVKPDKAVSGQQAFDAAYALALRGIMASANPVKQQDLQKVLQGLEQPSQGKRTQHVK